MITFIFFSAVVVAAVLLVTGLRAHKARKKEAERRKERHKAFISMLEFNRPSNDVPRNPRKWKNY